MKRRTCDWREGEEKFLSLACRQTWLRAGREVLIINARHRVCLCEFVIMKDYKLNEGDVWLCNDPRDLHGKEGMFQCVTQSKPRTQYCLKSELDFLSFLIATKGFQIFPFVSPFFNERFNLAHNSCLFV